MGPYQPLQCGDGAGLLSQQSGQCLIEGRPPALRFFRARRLHATLTAFSVFARSRRLVRAVFARTSRMFASCRAAR